MKNLKLYCILVFVFGVLFSVHSQDIPKLSFSAGDLLFTVDQISGRFGLRNIKENDFNLSSLLFDPGFPTSYIEICINGNPYRLEELKSVYPLGIAAGYQIDAIYQWENDIQIEIGYFTIDVKTNLDAIGIAVRITNISDRDQHTVSVKLLLDTDISEIDNKSLVYLQNGEHITEGRIFTNPTIPNYLFFGKKSQFTEKIEGAGLYLYPTISTNIPRMLAIGNWKYLLDAGSFPNKINPSLKYQNSDSIDIGVGVYFDKKILKASDYYDVASAISLNKNQTDFILDQKMIDKGVFAPERFEIEEILQHLPTNHTARVEIRSTPRSKSIMNTYEIARQNYRQKKLQVDTTELEADSVKAYDYLGNLLRNDTIWKYLFQLNFKMENIEEKINKVIKRED
ncbi:MAG: hypothetical protein ACRCTJ_02030 [Brevinema sp.]